MTLFYKMEDLGNENNDILNEVGSGTSRVIGDSGDFDHISNLEGQPELLIETRAGNVYIPFSGKKHYYGGYYNKLKDVVFHNASAQTSPIHHYFDPTTIYYSRDTQTIQINNRSQQTVHNKCTQMTKIGVYVSTKDDKVIIPKKYKTADELQAMFLKKVIIVQKYIRRFLAKLTVSDLRKRRQAHLDWLKLQETILEDEKHERLESIKKRQQYPRTKTDFTLLYNTVEKWKKEEIKLIESTVDGPERKAALCLLGEREAELLKIIHQRKLSATDAIKRENFITQLRKMSAAKIWKGYKGNVKVYTEPILQAKHLYDMFQSLTLSHLSEDERLDVLVTLKETVKTKDSAVSREIMDLVDREADLLIRGVKPKYLDVLHQRILILFKQFITTPENNPRVTELKKEAEKKEIHEQWVGCDSCLKCFPPEKFIISSAQVKLQRCKQCLHEQNIAHTRAEDTVFQNILSNLQTEERKLNAKDSIAFLMEEDDFRHLIEIIWNGRSIMSTHSELQDLVMCRWDLQEKWSPWNCILLTTEEARSHYNVNNPNQIYDENFIKKVHQRHLAAKNYFVHLQQLANKFTASFKLKLDSFIYKIASREESDICIINNT